VLGASIATMASAGLSPAFAQCAPDPTQTNVTTTCSGVDADGLTVGANGSIVEVQAGATVQRADSPAIIVNMPVVDTYFGRRFARIDVAGTVEGIQVRSGTLGTGSYDFYGTDVTISVAAGGILAGESGVAIVRSSGNPTGTVAARIDNAGVISGSGGLALVSGGTGASFDIVNRAGGVIGAIDGPLISLDNAGTIDGGTISAVTAGGGFEYNNRAWANSGSIRSTSASATMQGLSLTAPFVNGGSITNDGVGAAISATELVLTNTATGIISATGPVAIDAAVRLRLINSGVIEGDVVAGSTNYGGNSFVDSTDGVIDGDLTMYNQPAPNGFPTGNTLVARVTGAGALVTGVTGTITGGGQDELLLRVDADTTIDTAVPLFTGFDRLQVGVENGATAVLGGNFATPATLLVSGTGTLVNRGTLAANGQVLADVPTGTLQIVNEGTLRTDTATPYVYAVTLSAAGLTNAGLIQAAGGGVSIDRGSFANSGEVVASDIAVLTRGDTFSNDGTIRSTAGTGLYLTGSYSPFININRGTIEGATSGVRLSRALVNTGTIQSGNVAVALGSNGQIDNRAGGVITGGTLAIGPDFGDFNRTVVNAGTINGDVELGSTYGLSNTGNRYFALAGGVLNGNLRLGSGDTLVAELGNAGPGRITGITGTVTGNGAHLRYQTANDAAALHSPVEGFGSIGYQVADGAALTLTGSGTTSQQIQVAGTGTIDLALDIETANQTILLTLAEILPAGFGYDGDLAIVSRGTLSTTHRADDPFGTYAAVSAEGARFTNAGTINVRELTAPSDNPSRSPTSAIRGGDIVNEGTINLAGATGVWGASSFVNTGTISQIAGTAAATGVRDTALVENRGSIIVDGVAISAAPGYYLPPMTLINAAGGTIASSTGAAVRISGGDVTNAGTITGTVDLGYAVDFAGRPGRAYATGRYTAAGGTVSGDVLFGSAYDVFVQTGDASGVSGTIDGGAGEDLYLHTVATSRTVSLDSTPRVTGFEHLAVEVTGAEAVATLTGASQSGDLTVRGVGTAANTATINGSLTTYGDFPVSYLLDGTPATLARLDNRGTVTGDVTGSIGTLVNSGTIGGQVVLDAAANRVENRGTLTGAVLLGAGNDTFVQHGGATLSGVVSGGAGSDLFVMAADAAGALSASQLILFERAMQTGTGTIAWSGNFALPTVELEGGTLAVLAGQTLSTTGPVTITGADAGVTVRNAGTIAGAVLLGAGSDRYVEGPVSSAALVDGGAGIDTYGVLLAGDRSGIAARTGFERLAVEGTGTLTLTLDQDFAAVELAATGFTAALNGHAISRIDGSAGAEQVVLDGDTALVALGAGGDMLSLGATALAGDYSGGMGADTLRLVNAAPVSLSGRATGFETLALNSGALAVSGTLGTAGETLTFAGGAQTLTLAAGGTLVGMVDMGDGDDRFRLDRGGMLTGTVSGGGGTNVAELAVTDGLTLTGSLRDFAQVATTGSGTLTIGRGTALATPQLLLGAGTGRLVIDGTFAGGISSQGGRPVVAVTGGSAAAPVAFTNLTGIAELQLAGGWSTLAGRATLDRLAMSGGRFVGLAGSTLSATQIAVGTGATFGSAGTVNGTLTVAGTLSPGASPGTMVVNGNVALASSSTSVFEITPAASDLLRINGALAIAPGATLQLVADQRVTPGQSLDLITATGGITGSYTNVVRPASLFGFVVQDAQRIALVGAFLNDLAFAPPVQGAVAYVNDLLTTGLGTPALLTAVPLLLDPAGGTSADAFARLTPQPYAAATQLVVEQGLELARTARGDAFAASGDMPGPFAFAAALGRTDELAGDGGIARARSDSYGVVGGLGWSSPAFSLGAFVGTLDQRQDLRALGARTDADGLVAGIHARWSDGALGVKASIAYADGDATTTRSVPGGRATGGYDLTGWTADLALDCAVALDGGWTLRPGIGATAIRATRRGTAEGGDTPFLLDLARDRYEAVFVDGSVTMMRDRAAAIRPHLTAGLRYRVDGDRPEAVAALPGGPLALSALGAARAALAAHGGLGAEASVTPGLTLFGSVAGEAGKNTSQGSGQVGLRVAF
jgi:hypothetical protein